MSHIADTLSALDKVMNPLPPHTSRVGDSVVDWIEGEEGKAIVYSTDKAAEQQVMDELEAHGYGRQYFEYPGPEDGKTSYKKVADWNDVMEKAKRLIQSGNVQLLRNGYNNVVAIVRGDTGTYRVDIQRDDPESHAVSMWDCVDADGSTKRSAVKHSCEWADFAWGRTRQFKKFEGRMCSHALAALWASQNAPLDEAPPEPEGPGGPKFPYKAPPKAPMPVGPSGPPGGTDISPMGQPAQQVQPGPEKGQQPERPPEANRPVQQPQPQQQQPQPQATQPDILPPFPGEQMQLIPPGQLPVGQPTQPGVTVSVPGARGPSPFNPIQYPGGTYSKLNRLAESQKFKNGDFVRLEESVYGTLEGHPESAASGTYKEVPANSIGEVLGQDETTGWVECIFEGPQDEAGRLQPYHVHSFVEANKLTPMPDAYRPRVRKR